MITRKKKMALGRFIIPLGLAFCCLFFVRISSAKMLNENPIAKDEEVHIAGWDVDVSSSDSSNMTLDAGNGSETYTITVANNSEVTNEYDIKISNIPAGVKIGLDISSDSELVTPQNGEVTFTNTGGDLDFNAPNNTRTHTLTLAAEATANITQSSVDMAIEIQFEQKDPRL